MDNIVSTVITGVDNIFTEPTGCCEQTMSKLSPMVYGLYYLKQTVQETAENEEKGTKHITDGIYTIVLNVANYMYIFNMKQNNTTTYIRK